jgi:DNA-binding NarL/FixJ family response regulator
MLCQGRDRERASSELAIAHAIVEELADGLSGAAQREQFRERAAALFPDPPRLTSLQAAKREFDGVTARQREVAALIACGQSNREIAVALSLSERTVESHVTGILATLNFAARSQIAAWAVEKGLAGRSTTA